MLEGQLLVDNQKGDFMSISLQQYMTAGVHFGHKTRLWNPKMKPYIYTEKDGIHIINIYRTVVNLEHALTFVKSQVAEGKVFYLLEPSVQQVQSSQNKA